MGTDDDQSTRMLCCLLMLVDNIRQLVGLFMSTGRTNLT